MEDRLKQGEALFAEGKIEEAEKCFLSLLEENPENEEVLNNLGVIHYFFDFRLLAPNAVFRIVGRLSYIITNKQDEFDAIKG